MYTAAVAAAAAVSGKVTVVSDMSQPPPSFIPVRSGGGVYFAGAMVLLVGAAALVFWKKSGSVPAPQQNLVPSASALHPSASSDEGPRLAFAPPPPPKLEEDEPDAGSGAGKPAAKVSVGAAAAGPCGIACSGTATAVLQTALRGRAQSAQGCYNRALRTGEVSGSMTVSVQVGPSGAVCGASLTNDTVHSPEVASCVLSRFRGQTFPPPSGGCVNVNIPISFTIKP